MKKYIFLQDAIELLGRLMVGKRVQGVLFVDEETGRLTFKPYYSRGKHSIREWMIRKLEHGWVKESEKRIKVFESIPKELGTVRVMGVLDRERQEVKDALITRDIIEFS